MSYTLKQIAETLGAELKTVPGASEDMVISDISDPVSAISGQISFVASKAYIRSAEDTAASALIVEPDIADSFNTSLLIVENAYLAYAKISELFAEPRPETGVDPAASVSKTATLGRNVYIGPNAVVLDDAVIGDQAVIGAGSVIGKRACIGARTLLHPNVSVYYDVQLGDDCVIHSGAVIGSDGFGFAPTSQGYIKIHQLGTVIVGNKVEIGANTSIDRGALGNTEIRDGAIIDNLVHIAHNCVIGENTALAGQIGMAGSTTIGKNCTFGGQVGIAGHIDIGDNVSALGQTKITKSIEQPGVYSSGTGFSEVKLWRKNAARFNQLDDFFRRLQKLEKIANKED